MNPCAVPQDPVAYTWAIHGRYSDDMWRDIADAVNVGGTSQEEIRQ